jgi:chaperonin GroEL
MIAKQITSDHEARLKLKEGVDKLANVVKATLGPGGANVILQRMAHHHITKDGVSVASEVYLADPVENMGAQIVKEVATRTMDVAGDGTTTATVLAQAIMSEGIKYIDKGAKLIDLKRGIDIGTKYVCQELSKMARKLTTDKDITNIAKISANGDEEIGNLIGAAISKVGKDGVVTVDEGISAVTDFKMVEGMKFDRGYLSPYFVTNQNKMECELEKPVILLYDGAIMTLKEMLPIFDKYKKNESLAGQPMLIICHEMSAEALSTLVYNKTRGSFQGCVVQAPEFSELRRELLEDIAALTDSKIIQKEKGLTFRNAQVEVFGSCDKVRITQWSTTIIKGHGGIVPEGKTESSIDIRANQIREQIKDSNEYAALVLKSRLANLVTGVAVIYVGGSSELEIKEKKDRIDDAISATRAALEEGVLPGGGVAYLRAMVLMDGHKFTDATNADQLKGIEIVKKSLRVPFMTIAGNAGVSFKSLYGQPLALKRVLEGEFAFGFNARTMVYEDLMKAGVIDPVKVTRLALENAGSVSGMLLTTSAIISNLDPRLP